MKNFKILFFSLLILLCVNFYVKIEIRFDFKQITVILYMFNKKTKKGENKK